MGALLDSLFGYLVFDRITLVGLDEETPRPQRARLSAASQGP